MANRQQPKLPKEVRIRMYLQVDRGRMSVETACDTFGISGKTYWKWWNRDHGKNPPAATPRPHPQTKLAGKAAEFVLREKRLYNYGPEKMRVRLRAALGVAVSANAVYKFYRKKKLVRKPKKKVQGYAPLKEPYAARFPGDNVQLDVKYVPDPRFPSKWAYQYRFMDCFTNLQFCVDMPRKNAAATLLAWEGAKRAFPFPVAGFQTDNGSEFKAEFHEKTLADGIPHRFIPKRSAPWNGKIERGNRSVDDEFYLNAGRPWRTLAEYCRWYNHERPHLGKGMGGMTPWEKHQDYLGTQERHPSRCTGVTP